MSDGKIKVHDEASAEKGSSEDQQPYLPGISDPLGEDEELICDRSAYSMLRNFQTEHPCLSFDTVRDDQGDSRDTYPLSCILVAGTQAEKSRDNGILTLKLSNLHKHKSSKKEDEEDEDSSSSSEDEDETAGNEDKGPRLVSTFIPHHGGINRIRATRLGDAVVSACWNDQGKVQLWNLNKAVGLVEEMSGKNQSQVLKKEKPLFTFAGHQAEGFALDWSSLSPGTLASGDNRSRIFVWEMAEGGVWSVNPLPFTSHQDSVEDIQWSPTEKNVFASCSADGSIKLWDSRLKPAEACVCSVDGAHDRDVNVISWNKAEPFLLSGGDDCVLKIWDLRAIQYKESAAVFKHHAGAISSVHWYPQDSTIFAASGEDDQVTIWDLSVEPDDGAMETNSAVAPQLLFNHMGQKEIKEIRWHPQLIGVLISTSLDNFNVFRTVSV